MQVQLVFRAEGRVWKVFRSASRRGPGRHELTCPDEPTLRFDGSTPVNNEIRRLVGLDYEAFLRTVVLPQGRFHLLLQASKTDRTGILKGIFRLDRLEEVREQAQVASRRLRPELDGLKERRHRLLPDPGAALGEAEARREAAEAREVALRASDVQIAQMERRAAAAERDITSLQDLMERLARERAPEAAPTLGRLAGLAESLDEERGQVDAHRRLLLEKSAHLGDALAQAERVGEGIGALGAAESTVSSLREQLPGLLSDEAKLETEEAAIDQEDKAVTDEEEAYEKRSGAAEEARAAKERAALDARSAEGKVAEARQRLKTAREKGRQMAAASVEALKRSKEIHLLQAAVDAARIADANAAAERVRAQGALESIRRAHAAAHAAGASRPGDPCPVCLRILPTGFVPPAAPGEEGAVANLREAETRARDASKDSAAAEARLVNGRTVVREAEEYERTAAAEAMAALASLRELLPSAGIDVQDEVLLMPLDQEAAEAREAHREAEEAAGQLEGELSKLLGRLQVRRDAIRMRLGALDEGRHSASSRRQSCERMASGLPIGFRPALPLRGDDLSTIAGEIGRRREGLAQIERDRSAIEMELASAREALEELDRRRRNEVDSPSRLVELALASLAQRLADLDARLSRPSPNAAVEGSISERASWAALLEAETEAALSAAALVVAELREMLDGARDAVSQMLAEAGVPDLAGFREALADAGADSRAAARDISTAGDQIPLAAELDGAIGRTGDLVWALDELWTLLSDNKFVAHVVARKQRVLLAVASELLGSMTGQRFGFSDSFEIIDRLTGMPRGVKTLSGGETFLASLALGLGLVELAGRGGGRLDAVFLDEGFGSLDANSLAEALEALMSQAKSGRLVAVISHLRSVAETMEHVLAVRRGPDGSQAHWLGGDERDQAVSEEIQAGLLS